MEPASINLYLAIIRVLYAYLRYEENIKVINPVKTGYRLRVEEVANLSMGAVDLKRRRIMVYHGKGSKDRVVYMSDDARDALVAYLKQRSCYRIKKIFLVEKGD